MTQHPEIVREVIFQGDYRPDNDPCYPLMGRKVRIGEIVYDEWECRRCGAICTAPELPVTHGLVSDYDKANELLRWMQGHIRNKCITPNRKESRTMQQTAYTIYDLTPDQIALVNEFVESLGGDDSPAAETAPEEKTSKKDKKGKGKKADKAESSEEETSEPEPERKNYTKAQLGKQERDGLVQIASDLGFTADDVKGKRVGTLTDMILAKQKELKEEATAAPDESAADDEWEEEPAPDEKPAKKGKGKSDKKKGKKGKK